MKEGKWSKEEENILDNGYKNKISIKEIAKVLDRKVSSVKAKADSLKLGQKYHTRDKWTKEEDEMLISLYKDNKSSKEISDKIKRSISSVNYRITKLNLPSKYPKQLWEDLTGQFFDRLHVIGRAPDRIEPSGKRKIMWYCECSCEEHNMVIVCGDNLKTGNTTSCGCYQRQRTKEISIKRNKYYIYHNIVFVKYTNCEEYFICDLEDWVKLKDYCWAKDDKGYAVTKSNNKHKSFHGSLINKLSNEFKIDHLMQVSLGVCDNRKSNLRIVTIQNNAMNQKLRKDSTSNFTGVLWDKINQKWYAQIKFNYKSKFLGYFDKKEDAIKARLQAEHDLFREFSGQWYLFKEYGIDDSDLDYYSITLDNPEVQKKYGYDSDLKQVDNLINQSKAALEITLFFYN